jgi:hypothetical protein
VDDGQWDGEHRPFWDYDFGVSAPGERGRKRDGYSRPGLQMSDHVRIGPKSSFRSTYLMVILADGRVNTQSFFENSV